MYVWGKNLFLDLTSFDLIMRKNIYESSATVWFSWKKPHFGPEWPCLILALPLTAGDLGEVKFMYQLGCFQKPLPSLLESSGNSLFHNKSTGKAGSRLVSFGRLRFLATLSLAAGLLAGFCFCLPPSSGWFRATCCGVQKEPETSTGVDGKQSWELLSGREERNGC